jgi:hypothetical protein
MRLVMILMCLLCDAAASAVIHSVHGDVISNIAEYILNGPLPSLPAGLENEVTTPMLEIEMDANSGAFSVPSLL